MRRITLSLRRMGRARGIERAALQNGRQCLCVIRRMRGSEVDDIGEIALLPGQQRGAVECLRFHQLVELRIALRMAAAMQPVTQAGDHADCCASAASA